MDIEAWLQGLGLARYVPASRDNEIDWAVLPKLTSEDLREIGVVAIGHRRKLLEAIAELGASPPTSGATAAVPDASGPDTRPHVHCFGISTTRYLVLGCHAAHWPCAPKASRPTRHGARPPECVTLAKCIRPKALVLLLIIWGARVSKGYGH